MSVRGIYISSTTLYGNQPVVHLVLNSLLQLKLSRSHFNDFIKTLSKEMIPVVQSLRQTCPVIFVNSPDQLAVGLLRIRLNLLISAIPVGQFSRKTSALRYYGLLLS